MKQKIVMKVHKLSCCDKCRIKAMKIVATTPGLVSVGIESRERDQVVVIGEEVDCTALALRLRKKVGYAKILSVEQVQDDTQVPASKTAETKPAVYNCYRDSIPYAYANVYPPNPVSYVVQENPNPCSIM